MEILHQVKSLFDDKLDKDERSPVLTFSLPGGDDEFGLFAPEGGLWKQLLLYVGLQIPLQCAFAAIIYQFIVRNRGTMGAYLLGWGVVIPASCILPFHILEFLDVRNKVVKLAGGNMMSIVAFKCVEAMYGTPPSPVVEHSLSNYVAYYTTLVPFEWDKTTKARRPVTSAELGRTFAWLVFVFHAYSLLLSIMVHYNFKPFPGDNVELDQFHLSLDLLTPQHLLNGYLLTWMTFFNLALGFGATAFGQKAQGFSTRTIFQNPLLASRSATEFWTKRWNVMIHQAMKYGAFQPARKFFPASVAILVAFLASGLFHDYAWAIDFYHQAHYYDEHGHCHGCHVPILGKLTAFFLATGVIMLLERPISNMSIVRKISPKIPSFVVATFLVLVHVPISHWYYGDWVQAGYFNDFTIGLWFIRKL